MKIELTQYKKEGLSEIVFRYTMDYDLWKNTFSENLKRYKEELKGE